MGPCVQFDANYWKSRLRDAFQVPLGDQAKSTVSIFGRQPREHRLLADHETSEYFLRVEARGRTVEQWQPRPGDPDNHWLDGSVGNFVAASLLGIRLPAAELPTRPAPPRRGKRKATAINL